MAHKRTHQVLAITGIMLMAVLLAACKPGDPGRSTGAYPIDIFQEMHYNASLKAQEPPRFLPPEGSYPVEGGFIAVNEVENLELLGSRLSSSAEVIERGALLYRQNCSACHGLDADGNSFVGTKFAENGAAPPPPFDAQRIQNLSASQAFTSISGGAGFMPAFQGLLSDEDRWALVALVEATASTRAAALDAVNALDEPQRTLRLLELRGDTQ